MIDIELRAAALEDVAALVSMEAVLFSDAWSASALASTLSSPFSVAFIAYADGLAVGYWIASLLSPEGELLRIGVHPAYRRRGIGALLMEKFLQTAKERGCTDLFLEVRADNLPAASLYRHFGFSDNGLRRGYYKNPSADALLMKRCE